MFLLNKPQKVKKYNHELTCEFIHLIWHQVPDTNV